MYRFQDKNINLEVKSVVREEGKYKDKGLKGEFHEACKQLEAGKNMFINTVAPACNLSQNWAYQGFVCFPNVSDRSHFSSWNLSPEELSTIITRQELLTGGWLDSVKMMDNEATEEEYKSILSFMAGSGFITYSSQQHSEALRLPGSPDYTHTFHGAPHKAYPD